MPGHVMTETVPHTGPAVDDGGEISGSAERLRAILQSAVDAIITIEESGAIGSVNPAAERVFGYARSELIGRNVSMLMPSPYREEHDHHIANYLRTGVARINRRMPGTEDTGAGTPRAMNPPERKRRP